MSFIPSAQQSLLSTDIQDRSVGGVKRKKNWRFSDQQRARLEEAFAQNPSPKRETLLRLQEELGTISGEVVSFDSVKNWFGNRRHKIKCAKDTSGGASSSVQAAMPLSSPFTTMPLDSVKPSLPMAPTPSTSAVTTSNAHAPIDVDAPSEEESFLFKEVPPVILKRLRALYRTQPDADDATQIQWAHVLELRPDQVQFFVRWKQLQSRRSSTPRPAKHLPTPTSPGPIKAEPIQSTIPQPPILKRSASPNLADTIRADPPATASDQVTSALVSEAITQLAGTADPSGAQSPPTKHVDNIHPEFAPNPTHAVPEKSPTPSESPYWVDSPVSANIPKTVSPRSVAEFYALLEPYCKKSQELLNMLQEQEQRSAFLQIVMTDIEMRS